MKSPRHQYAVGLEISKITNRRKADQLAAEIRDLCNHLNEDVYVFVSSCERVVERDDEKF